MKQTWENGKKNLVSGPILAHLAIIPPLPLYSWVYLILLHCAKLSSYAISRKNNKPNSGNGKKPNFGLDFGSFDHNLPPAFFVDFTSKKKKKSTKKLMS